MYTGEWPWRELQLFSPVEEAAHTWQVNLQAVADHFRQTLTSGEKTHASKINYWLKCMYIETGRQNKGTVTAVAAIEKFALTRPWSAVKVCC